MSKIEWTDQTWNPVTGCNKVSRGCKNCYAEVMHKRLRAMGQKKYQKPFLDGAVTHEDSLQEPFSWKKPRMVFVNSMSDLFHEDVPFEFIDKVFAVMVSTPRHTYQILTKRPERMAEYFSAEKNVLLERWGEATYDLGLADSDGDTDAPSCWIFNMGQRVWPYKNIWIGTSVENQEQADKRIPHLLQCPAAVRFLSCEPLVGSVDIGNTFLSPYGDDQTGKGIHWVIAGGESGPKAQPMHPDWVRSLCNQCQRAGVPFFFKQWGNWKEGTHIDVDRNIVMLKDGTRIPYHSYRLVARNYSQNGWKEQRPTAMHRDYSKKGNELDGKKHEAFPEVAHETLTQ